MQAIIAPERLRRLSSRARGIEYGLRARQYPFVTEDQLTIRFRVMDEYMASSKETKTLSFTGRTAESRWRVLEDSGILRKRKKGTARTLTDRVEKPAVSAKIVSDSVVELTYHHENVRHRGDERGEILLKLVLRDTTEMPERDRIRVLSALVHGDAQTAGRRMLSIDWWHKADGEPDKPTPLQQAVSPEHQP